MRRSLMLCPALTAMAVTATAGCAARAAALPPAVAKAVDANRPGASIHKLDVDEEGGIKIYDFEFKDGRGEMDVAEDGTVLDVATYIDLKEVPEAAARVIQTAARSGAIRSVQRSEVRARIEEAGGKGTLRPLPAPEYEYEAELAKGGEIEVSADGRVIKGPKSMR